MEREVAGIVEDSLVAIGPLTVDLGTRFYDTLFETAPGLRPLFRGSQADHVMRFVEVLAYVVSNLRATDKITPILRDLGRRHLGYGVSPAHYQAFKLALLKTLQMELNSKWTPDVARAWDATIDNVGRQMLAGAEAAEPSAG